METPQDNFRSPLLVTIGKSKGAGNKELELTQKVSEARRCLEEDIYELCTKGKNKSNILPLHFKEQCMQIIRLDWPDWTRWAFQCVDYPGILQQNSELCQDLEKLSTILDAFAILFRYGVNLLKIDIYQSKSWHLISFENPVYQSKVAILKGHKEILSKYGYTKVMSYGLSFPDALHSPSIDTVKKVTADLAVAFFEVESCISGNHPHIKRMNRILFTKTPGLQQMTNSKLLNPDVTILKRHPSDSSGYSSNESLEQETAQTKKETVNEYNNAVIIDNPSDQNRIVVLSSDKVQGSHSPPYLVTPPDQEIKLPTCGLCKKNPANMQCTMCSQPRCEQCDDIWHKHPSRRSHSRQKVVTSTTESGHLKLSPVVIGGQPGGVMLGEAGSGKTNLTSATASYRGQDIKIPDGKTPGQPYESSGRSGQQQNESSLKAVKSKERSLTALQSPECDFCGKPGKKYCTNCEETYCLECDHNRHSSGKRSSHQRNDIKSPVPGEMSDEGDEEFHSLPQDVRHDSISVSSCINSEEELDVRAPPSDRYPPPKIPSQYKQVASREFNAQVPGFVLPHKDVLNAGQAFRAPTIGKETPAEIAAAKERLLIEAKIDKIMAEDIQTMEVVTSLRELKREENDTTKRNLLDRDESEHWQKHLKLKEEQSELEKRLFGINQQGPHSLMSASSEALVPNPQLPGSPPQHPPRQYTTHPHEQQHQHQHQQQLYFMTSSAGETVIQRPRDTSGHPQHPCITSAADANDPYRQSPPMVSTIKAPVPSPMTQPQGMGIAPRTGSSIQEPITNAPGGRVIPSDMHGPMRQISPPKFTQGLSKTKSSPSTSPAKMDNFIRSKSPVELQGQAEQWTCKHCTLTNTNMATNICEACHKTTPRQVKGMPTVKPKQPSVETATKENFALGTERPEEKDNATKLPRKLKNAQYYQQLEAENLALKQQAKQEYKETVSKKTTETTREKNGQEYERRSGEAAVTTIRGPLSNQELVYLADNLDNNQIPELAMYLGFDVTKIESYHRRNGGTLDMLQDWKNTSGASANQRKELQIALDLLGLDELAASVTERKLSESDPAPRVESSSSLKSTASSEPLSDRILCELAESISPSKISELGMYLGFGSAAVNTYRRMAHREPSRGVTEMLYDWREWQPRRTQRALLVEALRHSDCDHLANRLLSHPADRIPYKSPLGSPEMRHATSFSDLSFAHDEDKRRYEEMRVQSLQLVKTLREAENQGISPGRVECALDLMGDSDKEYFADPCGWIAFSWHGIVEEVAQRATQEFRENLEIDIDQRVIMEVVISLDVADQCLVDCHGNKDDAVKECTKKTQNKMIEIIEMGCYTSDDIVDILKQDGVGGDMEKALDALQKKEMAEYAARIWISPDEEDNDFFRRVIKTDKRSIRMLLVEYSMRSWGRANTAAKLIVKNEFNVDDVVVAAEECGEMKRAEEFLRQECSICYMELPRNKLMSLINCQCMMCRPCVIQHFEIIARDKSIMKGKCPSCDQPDLDDQGVAADYFQFLDILLREILDDEVYGLFVRKLRDWNLMQDRDFCWCAHCNSGFINGAPDRRKMRCPECNKLTCFLCKKQWLDQHEGISCDEFQQWKENNDPDLQAKGLAAHLNQNGIGCPRCKMRYELAKGGCMHFTCPQCTFEFCCGCNEPMKRGEVCGKLPSCINKGLHAHHPRDCLFYLRDREIPFLQQLLEDAVVQFNKDPPEGAEANQNGKCGVNEQKDGPNGLIDDKCGRDVSPGSAGLCKIHYKEYLVSLINTESIDPARKYPIEDLEIILKREEIPVPIKQLGEPDGSYRVRLLEEVKKHLPLTKHKRQVQR